MGRFQLESIYLYFPASSQLVFYVINTKKYHVFAPMGRFQLESNDSVDNVVIATKDLQDRNIKHKLGRRWKIKVN